MDSYHSSTTKPIYRGTQIIWYIVSILEVLLIVRFFLKLLDANPGAGFTSFMYSVTGIFVDPFRSVFGISQVQGAVFEWTTLLAMLVYLFIAWAIAKLLVMSRSVSTPEAAKKLNEQDK